MWPVSGCKLKPAGHILGSAYVECEILDFSQLTTIKKHKVHLQTVEYLQKTARPAIVIAASGMCTGGRIVNYLKALIEDERTDILFTGYQARGTTGKIIQKYGTMAGQAGKSGYVFMGGNKYVIKTQIVTLSGYSAHADQRNLLNFVKRMRNRPQQIRLVHGDAEAEAKKTLQNQLTYAYPEMDVIIPAS